MGSSKNKSIEGAMSPLQLPKQKYRANPHQRHDEEGDEKHFSTFGKNETTSFMCVGEASFTQASQRETEEPSATSNRETMIDLVDEWNECDQECSEYKHELFSHIQTQVHDCERKLEKAKRKWTKWSMDDMKTLQEDIEECIVLRKRELFKIKTVNQTVDKWNTFAGKMFAIGRVNLQHCENDLQVCEATIDTMAEQRPTLSSHMIFRMSGQVNMRLRRLGCELNKMKHLCAFNDHLVRVRDKIVLKHASPDWPQGLVSNYLEMCDQFDVLYEKIGNLSEHDTTEIVDRMEQALCVIERQIPA